MSSSYKKIKIEDLDAVVLNLRHGENFSEITVLPVFGANLLQFVYNGKPVIDFNTTVLQKRGFTGTPVLFPTPNRVAEAKVIYDGMVIEQVKNGEKRVCHGLVYDEAFQICNIDCGEQSAFIDLSLHINREKEFFNSFPFECILHIIYLLSEKGLEIKYSVENLSANSFQYGFGLHPYFVYGENAVLKLPVNEALKLNNNYPTGEIYSANERFVGINSTGIDLQSLCIDDDFLKAVGVAVIEAHDRHICITTSEEFKHFVVYKNIGDDFICVEPQTCSINAHNLAQKGFEYANVINIAPKQKQGGFVKIEVEEI